MEGIPSKNFTDWTWFEFDEVGQLIDPYDRLPKLFQDVDEEQIQLLTDSDALKNGGVSIDSTTGYFSGSGLTIVSPDGTTNAKIYGAFHGDGASGVSGIYFEDAVTPLINGAIVGSR